MKNEKRNGDRDRDRDGHSKPSNKKKHELSKLMPIPTFKPNTPKSSEL